MITFQVEPGWRPTGWVAMLYWSTPKSGPPTMALHHAGRGLDGDQRRLPARPVARDRGVVGGGVLRDVLEARVEGGVDLQPTLEELVLALGHGGAQRIVELMVGDVEQAVLYLGHEVVRQVVARPAA